MSDERKTQADGPDPEELADGSGTDTDTDHTAEGGDDDQFQG